MDLSKSSAVDIDDYISKLADDDEAMGSLIDGMKWINEQFGQKPDMPCMFDQLKNDPHYHGQAMGLHCPCPKCSPRC